MGKFFVASASGWIGAIIIGAVALLPYLLRRTRLSVRLGIALPSHQPYLRRMWPHYWLAYAATGLSFVHAWTVMGRGTMARTSGVGLYIATIALLLLFLQIALGLTLQQRTLPERKSIREWHFWIMGASIVLVGAHIWLNG